MVPEKIRGEVYRTYRKGQEKDYRPSREWIKAARAAQEAVAEKEAVQRG
jgi:hypothetical protein